jgi:hypothetical protein
VKLLLSAILLIGVPLVSGCATREDRRLAEDQQSCLQMGHSPETPQFSQCMQDLNQRRCDTKVIGERHLATQEMHEAQIV